LTEAVAAEPEERGVGGENAMIDDPAEVHQTLVWILIFLRMRDGEGVGFVSWVAGAPVSWSSIADSFSSS